MSRISTAVRGAAILLVGVATPIGAPAVSAQDTAGDTIAADGPATPGSNAARLDSLRERAAELRAEILRLRIEFGIRMDRLESGLVFRVPEADGAGRSDGEALRRVASLVRRHYPEARLGVRVPAVDGAGCGTASDDRRTRRVIRRLTTSTGLDANRVVPADCERLRPVLARQAADRGPGRSVLLLIDRPPTPGGTS